MTSIFCNDQVFCGRELLSNPIGQDNLSSNVEGYQNVSPWHNFRLSNVIQLQHRIRSLEGNTTLLHLEESKQSPWSTGCTALERATLAEDSSSSSSLGGELVACGGNERKITQTMPSTCANQSQAWDTTQHVQTPNPSYLRSQRMQRHSTCEEGRCWQRRNSWSNCDTEESR